jgi:hypothetical protein
MHPLINVQLAKAVRDDRRRRNEERRNDIQDERRPGGFPRLRAPWPPGLSPGQAKPDRFA